MAPDPSVVDFPWPGSWAPSLYLHNAHYRDWSDLLSPCERLCSGSAKQGLAVANGGRITSARRAR